MALMILVFIIGGSFSFIVEDAIKRTTDDHLKEVDRQVQAASSHPELPHAIEAYTVDHRYDNVGG